jgi:hypothetical protein
MSRRFNLVYCNNINDDAYCDFFCSFCDIIMYCLRFIYVLYFHVALKKKYIGYSWPVRFYILLKIRR